MTTDANSVLMGATAPKRLDLEIGQWAGGPIVAFSDYHAREYDASNPGAGALKYFPSGDPIKGVAVDMTTASRTDVDDDGTRRLWADKQRLLKAIREACLAAKCAEGIDVGGTLYVCWTGTEKGKGGGDANTYAAQYTPSPAQHAKMSGMNIPGGTIPPAPNAPQPVSVAPQSIPPMPPSAPQWPQNIQQGPPPSWAADAVREAVVPQPVPAPPVAVPSVPARRTLPASVAAAMANAGIDTSEYDIVPG